MRKIIFAILVVVLLIFTGFVIYGGTNIGKFKIWGIKQISEENNKIDQANADLGTLVNVSYPDAITKLNNSGEEMQEKKKEYEEQVAMISNSKYYAQSEKYKIEFLWTKIGNYAKDNKVTPKMQVTNGSTSDVYNLTIIAVGRYANVASFIYAIENDSKLGFKIEDFSMIQAGEGQVQGTFTCKEIRIDLKSIDNESADTSSTNENSKDTDNSNTGSSTATNNTTTNATTNETTQSNTTGNTAQSNTTSNNASGNTTATQQNTTNTTT